MWLHVGEAARVKLGRTRVRVEREDEMDAKIVVEIASEETVETPEPQVAETEGALALAEAPELEPAVTREQRRSRRKRAVRARTISVKRMTKRELELGRLLYPEVEVERPETRADCVNGERPC